jgi:PEGA domain
MLTSHRTLNKKFALVFMLLALPLVLFSSYSNVFAKSKKAKYGTIKIMSTPAGLLLTIDGKPHGETAADYRAFDLEPGTHSVDIRLPNGTHWTRSIDLPAGRVKCVVVNYRPIPPIPASPCPFPVNISAPQTVNEGEIITYAADVNYGGTNGLKYKWTVSPAKARILSGDGTPTITVDSTGLAGQQITATLVVDDGTDDLMCRQAAQSITTVPVQEKRVIVGREFDRCCSCSNDDQKARLDNLAVELQADPTATTYLFAYAGRSSQTGQADRLLARARDYLVSQRGIDGARIVLINGGFREEDCVEAWIVPQGATAPQPTPTVQPGDVKPAPSTRPRKRSGN